MIFNVITLFPDFFESPLESGLIGKARKSGILTVNRFDLRCFSDDRFKRCDDYPYGGGSGMVLMPAPLIKALESVKKPGVKTILTSPGGKMLTQEAVKKFSLEEEITIVCGHYEGIDERIVEKYIDQEISTGDYILSGGEFAALIIIDTIARYIPGFMSNSESLEEESFEGHLLEYPHYTRPAEIDGMSVPSVLLSGNHKEIERWRRKKSEEKTIKVRPDLYKKYLLRKIRGEE